MALRGENRWPNWQPIATAPKDGRDVLLCQEGERQRAIGYSSGRLWVTMGNIYGFAPTHWCPLPDAVGAPAVGELP